MYLAAAIIIILGILFYASYSIRSGVYVKALCKAHTEEKVVAITFDDGPDMVQTPKVLDVLKEYNVQAVFFVIGHAARRYPEILKRITEEGHLIGNHTDTHSPWFPLFGTGRMVDELQRCDRAIEKATGSKPILFRPPFGVTNPTIARAVKKQNYNVIGWSIRSLDTTDRSREKIFERIKKRITKGAVILLHDNRPQSDVLLRMTLNQLTTQGYAVKRVDKLFGL